MEKTPDYLKVFEKLITSKDGKIEKQINEIIDIDKHTWTTDSGNIIMKHEAVLHLRKFTGAKFLRPELQKEISNPGNIVYLAAVEFPDGEISFEIGEANSDNTYGLSRGIKSTMAFKRGYDRAFLRSDYIGLFEVYSEEESETFKKTFVPHPEEGNLPFHEEKKPNPIAELNKQFPPTENLFLPENDEKYPSKNIISDVLKIHRDYEYIEKIAELYPNNEDFQNTVRILREMTQLKRKQQEMVILNNSPTQVQTYTEPAQNNSESEQIAPSEQENLSSQSTKTQEDLDESILEEEKMEEMLLLDLTTPEDENPQTQSTEEFLKAVESIPKIPITEPLVASTTSEDELMDAETFLNSLDNLITFSANTSNEE